MPSMKLRALQDGVPVELAPGAALAVALPVTPLVAGGVAQTVGKHLEDAGATSAHLWSEIGVKRLPSRSVTLAGYASAGDAGAGARLIAGRGDFEGQDITGAWFHVDLSSPFVSAGHYGVVANDPTKAEQNGIIINKLMEALYRHFGGGFVYLPAGKIYVDRTLDNCYPNVLVRGRGCVGAHDVGAAKIATSIVPVGSAFTVLKHRSRTAAEQGVPNADAVKNVGGGFEALSVVGNGLAPRLLEVCSIEDGLYKLHLEGAVGAEAALFTCWSDYRAGGAYELGESSDNRRLKIDLEIRQDIGSVRGAVFSGALSAGNTCFCADIRIVGRTLDGDFIVIEHADNLSFALLSHYSGSADATKRVPIRVRPNVPGVAVVGNILVLGIYTANGAAIVETIAARPNANKPGDLTILFPDTANSAVLPQGPNVCVHNYFRQSIGWGAQRPGFGEDGTTTALAMDRAAANPGVPLLCVSGSQRGPRLEDLDGRAVEVGIAQVGGAWTYRFGSSGVTSYTFDQPLVVQGGFTQAAFNPFYLFTDTSAAINRTRVGFGAFQGDFYFQFRNDDNSYRDNPVLISTTTFDSTFSGAVLPKIDNTKSLGSAAQRWSVLYAGTGTINTSDARQKTPVVPLIQAEIAAARDLVKEIGLFQFLEAAAAKGDAARRHVGMTVQRAMEVMRGHGLDPVAYAFICHDTWPASPAQDEVREPVLDADGKPTGETIMVRPAIPARPAGDCYGFRADELMLFLAAGIEARLDALESAAA